MARQNRAAVIASARLSRVNSCEKPPPFGEGLFAFQNRFAYFCLAMILSLMSSYTFCGTMPFCTSSSLPL